MAVAYELSAAPGNAVIVPSRQMKAWVEPEAVSP
jgi:hypothetical protein